MVLAVRLQGYVLIIGPRKPLYRINRAKVGRDDAYKAAFSPAVREMEQRHGRAICARRTRGISVGDRRYGANTRPMAASGAVGTDDHEHE